MVFYFTESNEDLEKRIISHRHVYIKIRTQQKLLVHLLLLCFEVKSNLYEILFMIFISILTESLCYRYDVTEFH